MKCLVAYPARGDFLPVIVAEKHGVFFMKIVARVRKCFRGKPSLLSMRWAFSCVRAPA